MTDRLVKAGVIGCGKISAIYLHNAKRFENFDVVAVADLRLGAAQSRAREYQIPRACSIEELLADPEIEIVLNLTPHRIHGQVGLSVLDAGKCPYNEKPLAVDRGEGLQMLEVAAARGLRIGAAPDTFFGGAWQTARQLWMPEEWDDRLVPWRA
jgi:predicted dehydrogenase